MHTQNRKRVARTGLVAGIAFGFVPFIGLTPAHACSCMAADDAQLYKWADVVFKGTLPGKQQTGTGNGAGDIVLTFDATRLYKGAAVHNQRVRTADNGAACGLEISGTGPFLVFAGYPRDDEGKAKPLPTDRSKVVLEANLCGGTRPIGADEDPSFGKGTAIEAPKPVEQPNSGGDGDAAGGAYGLFGGVLATLMAVLGGLLGWTRAS